MSAALALAVLALGWSIRRARGAGSRRSPLSSGRGLRLAEGPLARWWARRPRLGGPEVDPAPLLRFRTAIERGASVVQAFESVAAGSGRWSVEASRIVRRVHAGAGVQAALDRWVAEDRDPSVRLLADALAISATTGGSHIRAVDAVIDAVRERAALQREVRALASQAHTSAVVLVLLPIAFALAIATVDPRVRAFYLGSALGPVCLAAGALLDAVGAWVMLRLVRSVA